MNAQTHTSVNAREKDYTWRGPILSKSSIANILSQIDIVDVIWDEISKKWWKFKSKKNKVDFLSLCPFHSERSPSFQVNREKQIYHCFWCWTHGDAIWFLAEYHGWTNIQAIQYLAKKYRIKIRYWDIYKEDYFGQYDTLLDWTFNSLEWLRYPHDDSVDIDRLKSEYSELRIQWLKTAIAAILWERERKYSEIFGKSKDEVLGNKWDGFDIPNSELSEISTGFIDYDQIILEIEDELDNERREDDKRNQEEERLRILLLKESIRSRIWQLQEEKRENKSKIEEMEREREFLLEQEDAITKLCGEISLHVDIVNTFFQWAQYGMITRWSPLVPWSMWKFVCIYSKTSGFSCVFWEKRMLTQIPWKISQVSKALSTVSMAEYHWIYHKDIAIPWEATWLWWAQFMVLDNKTIVISGQSSDFFWVPHEIVRKALVVNGYKAIFLDDSPSLTLPQVYSKITW